MLGAGGFYDPYDTSGWWGVWNTHPGDIGYRRPADSSSGGGYGGGYEYGIQGNNLLTPGVIVSPAGLNGQIENASSYPMGNDADDSSSAPPEQSQGFLASAWSWTSSKVSSAVNTVTTTVSTAIDKGERWAYTGDTNASDDVYQAATEAAGGFVGPRLNSAVKAASGVMEVGTGAGMTSTGVGAIPGGVMIAHGADTTVAGIRGMIDGKDHDTFTAQVVTAATGSKTAGTVTDMAVPLIAGGVGIVMAKKAAATGAGAAVEAATTAEAAEASSVGAETAAEAGSVLKNCFPAGTLVATPEGHQAIEKVRPGDRVWAFDLVTGAWRPCRVLRTFRVAYEGHSASVTVADDAEETIQATLLHPFWVARGEALEDRPRREHLPTAPNGATTPGRWVDAGDLRPGDQVLLRSGRLVPVHRVRIEPFHEDVYNFQVEELECYAVGWKGVLVHNNNGIEAGEAAAAGEGASAGEAVTSESGGITPYRDPAHPGYNNGATHIDHAQARSLGGTNDPSNLRPLAAETNLRKGGYEGALKSYEQYLIRNGMSPEKARAVIQSEIDAMKVSPPPRPMDPRILDQLPANPPG